MRHLKPNSIVLAIASLCGSAFAQSAAPAASGNDSTQHVTVTGEGDKLGAGLLLDEDAAKARSSVTKAQIEKTRPGTNPFQELTLLPGVNSSSFDATGMFGGNLRVRGYNSDQMGFTINGAPVNDSGNFAVFPQEYVDTENVCSLYVTQGAPDSDAPHVGASGGNVGIQSCAPENTHRVRVGVSAGDLDFYRVFVRFDTGKVGDFKGYVSGSRSEVDKWKGPGEAKRDHVDAGGEYDLGSIGKIVANASFNYAVNNNFLALTPAQFATQGYYSDFSATPPQHLTPVNGTAQTEKSPSPVYAGYSLNPFWNYLLTAKGSFTLTPKLSLDVLPYYWYGYGTGGNQQSTLAESSGGGFVHGGLADINGDGDTKDTVLVYTGSVTKTERPGIETTLNYALDNQTLSGGVWFERAQQVQTKPATRVTNGGGVDNVFIEGNDLLYNDGATYEGRDQHTETMGTSFFVQDAISLFSDKLLITPSTSYRILDREFTNYANSGTGNGADYAINQRYAKILPSLTLSLKPTSKLQLFADVGKNFRVPNNSEFSGLGRGITFANGVGTYNHLAALGIKPESSINSDVGARYHASLFTLSATVFYNKLRDRIATSYNPNDNLSEDTNVGKSTTKGIEIEAGTVPIHGFSAYVSGTYTKSTIDQDVVSHLVNGNIVPYATAGKQFPDTPKGMAALSVQWAQGPYLVNIAGKYTSARDLTLVDDVHIAGFTTVDLNAAWKLPNPSGGHFRDPVIRFNVSNLFDRKYFLANAGSGANITPDATGNPVVYAGAPRFSSVSFQIDYY